MDNDVLHIRELRQTISSSLSLSERIEVALLSNEVDRKDLMNLNRSYKGMEERVSALEKKFKDMEKRVSQLPPYRGSETICALCDYKRDVPGFYINTCARCKRYVCNRCRPYNCICIECNKFNIKI